VHNLLETDVFGTRPEPGLDDAPVRFKAKVHPNGVGFAANETRVRVWQHFHDGNRRRLLETHKPKIAFYACDNARLLPRQPSVIHAQMIKSGRCAV
jgi:hypothetical protein